eukprot:gene10915-9747_t
MAKLDACAGSTTEGFTLSEYAEACSREVDAAVAAWPVVKTAGNGARVYCGYAVGGESKNLSVMWVQEFASTCPALPRALQSICQSKDIAVHAKEWDSTFVEAEVVGSIPYDGADSSDRLSHSTGTGSDVVHWQFAAGPLSAREMVYTINQTTTYAYASVSDAWVAETLGGGSAIKRTGKVRSFNMFPTCDRVTILPDGQGVRVEHLMTTRIGGWVPKWAFNNLFKSALIDANAHEAEEFKTFAENLAAKMEEK